jgi:hypothetical protein
VKVLGCVVRRVEREWLVRVRVRVGARRDKRRKGKTRQDRAR